MIKISFKKALLLSISFLVAVSVGTTNYLSFNRESNALQTLIYESTQKFVEVEAKKVNQYIKSKEIAVNNLANDYKSFNYNDGHAERMRVAGVATDVINMMVAFETSDSFASASFDGWIDNKNPSDYDARVRPWYRDAKSSGKLIYTDAYHDISSGVYMVSIAKYFGSGVVLADVSLDVLNKTVEDITIPGALSIIISEDTTALASTSNAVKVGDKLNDLPELRGVAESVVNNNSTLLEYDLKGVEKVMFSKRIELGEKSWYLLIALDKNIVFSAIEEAKYEAIISTILYLVISIVLALLAINYFYRPIVALKLMIDSLSRGDGDLTQRLEVNSDDDIGQIAQGVNAFIENLQAMMLEIESSTIKLQQDVIALTAQTQSNGEILSKHVIETEQIVTAIEEMNSTAETVAHHASETAQFTSEAKKMGGESLDVVNDALAKVSSLMTEVDETASNISDMSDQTKGIGSILNVIGDIAEQTNLLALNAAIEAARAGEQGRGFAVVADEVRTLASRTQVSTSEIDKALDSLVNGSNIVADSMSATKITCNNTAESTEQVGQRINSLSEHITEINDLSLQIAAAAEEQNNVTQEVSRNMTSINDMVNQLNANGQETAQQTKNIELINSHLTQVVEKFRLR
ncbi:methyl-accepting chemotaxis protein [Vibrio sp. MACH09]|uniref:methyl-accepting chemotaxis protein n=1 Tax=Vibrio sp. MACH09 TaxID=3025122 RepID=UPI00278EA89D|nr:methyl-accepting chemotaxis protein [Vibrio sp. MACH09]GLO61144.1 methyl-accepting chemotaxis protein [Vibrio sp. MACH09]